MPLVFLINLPLGIFAVVGAFRFLPEFRSERRPRLDVAGVLLAGVAAFLLLFPLVQGRELDWPVWIFAMLAAGVALFGLFGVYESRRERRGLDALVTPSLFRKRAFTSGLLLGLVFFAALIGTSLVLTLYLQVGLGYSPLKAGLTTLPQALGTVAGFIVAGAGLSERLGRRLLLIGTAIMALGTAGVAVTVHLTGADITPWLLIPALLPLGAGMGLAMAPFFNIVLAGVDDEETGSASGALTSVQQLGGAFGIAVLGTVFFGLLPGAVGQHVEAVGLRPALTAAAVPADAQPAIVTGIRACLQDRTAEEDPSVQPASCRDARGASTPEIGAYAQEAVHAGFRDTTVRSLLVALALLVAAFGLAFLLPRRARPDGEGH
jgi:MFS family permease